MLNNNLGIPSIGIEYQRLLDNQNTIEEFEKTRQFLRQVVFREIQVNAPELIGHNLRLQFINHGDTQLVYVLSSDDKKYAILVGQPGSEYGIVRKEFDNLNKLSAIAPNLIVRPEYYFASKDRELYIAPYFLQARCIASQDTGWGLYIPEPYYRFEHFTPEERTLVNTVMIANLVRLYDDRENLGVASCKIGGGDFILEKEWSFEPKTLENTLKRMKLIAARELIRTSLDEYINLLKKEFLLRTYYNNSKDRDLSILINHKSSAPMTNEEIDKGIQLGLNLKYY